MSVAGIIVAGQTALLHFAMTDSSTDELRDNLDGLLRRVEGRDHFQIAMNCQPDAQLTPLSPRPQWMSWEAFMRDRKTWQADPGLTKDLAELIPETTDDVPIR